MSDPDGDASSRLSNALDEILRGVPSLPSSGPDPAVAPDPVSTALPEIVTATEEPVPPPITPALPPRPPQTVGPVNASVAAPQPVETVPAMPARPYQPAAAPNSSPSGVTGWADHVSPTTTSPATGLRSPGRRPRVRKVTRVVRHVDPWSVFKLAMVFSLVGYLVMLTSGVLLWRVADSTGTLDNIERWFTQFGWETFELKGGEMFHNAWVIGLFLAVGATGAAVLAATLFNLVSDIVGGIRVTVLEEEVVERTASSARRYVVRRPPLGSASAPGSAVAWSVDDAAAPATPDAASVATGPSPVADQDWSVDD